MPSQAALARKEKTFTKQMLSKRIIEREDTARTLSPLGRWRQSITLSPLTIQRRNSTGSISSSIVNTAIQPPLSPKQEFCRESKPKLERRASMVETRQPPNSSPSMRRQQHPGKQMHIRGQQQLRSSSIDQLAQELATFRNNQSSSIPLSSSERHKQQQRRSHKPKLLDSPAGSYQRIPRGYIPLLPQVADLAAASETSCSTHSSFEKSFVVQPSS